MWDKIQRWWWFTVKNPVVRRGEKGGFKWCFRRFWLEIATVSGNFRARYMADAHPYAYLLAGKDDSNIEGFCQTVYMLSYTITTDQGLVNDIQKAFQKYQKRLDKGVEVKEDETEERIALEEVKSVQEHIELPEKERKKVEKDINKRFKKKMKDVGEA